jgi:predicted transcriptional regulator
MKSFTVQLEDDVADKLSGLANVRGVSVEYLVAAGAEALADDLQERDEFADGHQWSAEDIAVIEEGLAQIERGETIPHEQVVADIKAKFGW